MLAPGQLKQVGGSTYRKLYEADNGLAFRERLEELPSQKAKNPP